MPTLRQQIQNLLVTRAMSARELSQAIGIREREVYPHLAHIARSVKQHGRQLRILPFACLACGYQFAKRNRFTRPGRCPRCKRSRIETPQYIIV
jgi:predicted Zn-ribbon and HTH transcriptional regulator